MQLQFNVAASVDVTKFHLNSSSREIGNVKMRSKIISIAGSCARFKTLYGLALQSAFFNFLKVSEGEVVESGGLLVTTSRTLSFSKNSVTYMRHNENLLLYCRHEKIRCFEVLPKFFSSFRLAEIFF